MSILSVFHTASPALPHKVLTHHDDIAATLAEHGVRFEHAEPGVRVRAGTRRWVELGEAPFCLALRLYGSEQGAQARFTGDVSARAFLGIDEL